MRIALISILICFGLLIPLQAQSTEHQIVLENLLNDFLEGASVNDYEMHDRFWHDDLIYTSAAGERITKTDIMNGLSFDRDTEEENLPVYSAEEIRIQIYDEFAVLAFMLVADVPTASGNFEQMFFYNTGTFLLRDEEWRAVAWQATRIGD